MLEDNQLPDGKYQQDGRKDEIDQSIGDKDDTEDDDNEAQQNDRSEQGQCALDLTSVESDEQGNDDDGDKPVEAHQKLACHDDEIMVHEGVHGHDGNGEQYETGSDYDIVHFQLHVFIVA